MMFILIPSTPGLETPLGFVLLELILFSGWLDEAQGVCVTLADLLLS